MSDLAAQAAPAAERPQLSGMRTYAGVRLGIAVWALTGLALLFCGAMTRGVSYDEDQYIAAGVLTLHLMPYRDFAYLQAPLYPLVLAPFFAVAHGWFMLMGRLVSFGLATCSALLLWHLVRRLGAGLALAMVLLTACLTSPFLLSPLANARNDGLPLTLMLAGLAVHLWAEERGNEPRPGRPAASPAALFAARFAAALLFGLAAEAKVSYVFAPLVLGLHALFAPRRRLLPTALGGLVSLLPAAFFYAVAPEQFVFGVLQYHLTAPFSWYTAAHMAELLQPWERLSTLGEFATLGGNLTLMMLSVALALVATARRRKWKRPGRMLIALTAGATAFALLPAPSWAMYFAATAPLLACCVAHLDRTTTYLTGAPRKRILLVVAGLALLPYLALQLRELPKLLDSSQWVGVDAHRNAQKIRTAIAAAHAARLSASPGASPGTSLGTSLAAGAPLANDVATLFPLWVVDANPIESTLATGPFIFRSGDGYDPGLLASLHALSPSTLDPIFDADPPGAIYAGRYGDAWQPPMDKPLADYAERHHWTLVRTDEAGGRLWVRPEP